MDNWATTWLLDKGEYCKVVVPFARGDQPLTVSETIERAPSIVELGLPRAPGAYIQRNRYMVDLATTVVGFWDGRKGGTSMTLAYARRRGRAVFVIRA